MHVQTLGRSQPLFFPLAVTFSRPMHSVIGSTDRPVSCPPQAITRPCLCFYRFE
jgi:hypothetical protein